jgi:hypothetical protein
MHADLSSDFLDTSDNHVFPRGDTGPAGFSSTRVGGHGIWVDVIELLGAGGGAPSAAMPSIRTVRCWLGAVARS